MKEVDPIKVRQAKQASLFGNLLLGSRSYFTPVSIQFEKRDKNLQNLPNVKFFHKHEAIEERKPERNLVSDKVSILHLIQANSFNAWIVLFIVLHEGSIGEPIILWRIWTWTQKDLCTRWSSYLQWEDKANKKESEIPFGKVRERKFILNLPHFL